MKSLVVVLLLSVVGIGAQAQSACPPGHEALCQHPSTSGGGGGGNSGGGGGSSGNSGNSGESRADQAEEHNRNGRIYQKRYAEAGREEDLKAAFAEFQEAWRLDKWGAVGIIELCNKINSHQCAIDWAEAALHTKFEENASVHAWLHYTIAINEYELAQAQYNTQCVVHTSASENGSTVDSQASIAQSLRDCEKLQRKIASLKKKTDEAYVKLRKYQG